jgi:hypothetical protein
MLEFWNIGKMGFWDTAILGNWSAEGGTNIKFKMDYIL